MASKTRSKTRGANMPVPQTLEEATEMVGEIGVKAREIKRIQADLDDAVAAIKADAEKAAAPLREDVEALTEGVRIWAEANRTRLTDGGRVKFADLATGKILWRLRPPKVTIRGADAVLEALRGMGLTRFIRTTSEIDKDAMRRDPDAAKAVPGVAVGSAGEEFVVEPVTAPLSGTVEPVGGAS